MKLTQLLVVTLLSVLLLSIAVAGAQAQSEGNGSEGGFEEGESHCALGGLGLLLVFAALGAGFLVSGRFGRFANFKPLPIHKIVAVAMAAF